MSAKNNIFQFKEFDVIQEKSAMKVGTDAIILGAWAEISDVDSILDIGTGTGILALMLAQRSNASTIDAVEIDADAFEEAVINFENSPWGDRLFCYNASVQDFAEEMDERYDLIICNPPYFAPYQAQNISKRQIARAIHKLDHLTLLKNIKKLLADNGTCAFSIPFNNESIFIESAASVGLKLQQILRLQDTFDASFVRSFIQFGLCDKTFKENILVLKNKDKSYTEMFKVLTKDFYTIF